jgi:hypothetical protein
MATVVPATAPTSRGEEISLVLSVWRFARRYPRTAVWIGGAAAIAYFLFRRSVRVPRTQLRMTKHLHAELGRRLA